MTEQSTTRAAVFFNHTKIFVMPSPTESSSGSYRTPPVKPEPVSPKSAEHFYTKWKLFAPLGLILTGLGVSLIGDAILVKAGGAVLWQWFLYGTVGLAVFNAGICVFGEAVKCRMRYEKSDG
jgi:hypothetical protein